jgi:hypothetical protein
VPSRKWWATQVTAVTGWVIALIQAGHLNDTLEIAAVTILSQAVIGWLIPNDPAQAGVKGQSGQP